VSSIVLSASVRQNLLSLQSTASLLATTQNDLATGNKVNSALDDPTSYFTAAALNNRASDINNLLDSIGNGVQVLQAANTGITSLQSLVSSAQSVANQVLQTAVGYDTKSSVASVAISGANANNLLGTGSGYTDATFAGVTATGTITAAFTSAATTGSVVNNDNSTPVAITAATQLVGTSGTSSNDLATAITNGSTLVVNGTTITFSTATTASSGSVASGFTIGIGTGSTATVATVLSDIDAITGTGTASSVAGGKLVLNTGTSANLTLSGTAAALTDLGLSATTVTRTGGATSTTPLTGTTLLSGSTASTVGAISPGFTAGDTLVVDNKTLTFVTGAAGANQISTTGTVSSLLAAIDAASGNTGPASSISGGGIVLHTGTANGTLSITSSDAAALQALGLGTSVTQAAAGAPPALSGKTLQIAATGINGIATNITFGTGVGQVSSLNQLNSALAANNLQATINSTGALTIVTTNNAASATIGAVSGTAAASGNAFFGLVGQPPVADPDSQSTRAGLIAQYNNILAQIDTTSQDSSFNGINLLEGDTLNLTFDETGKSTLKIQGDTLNTAGLDLSTLTAGVDFLDSNSAQSVLTQLNAASATLRSEASNLGSNLSIVEIRQDFSKSLINVLQTGASNLTLADTNEEAANSQALSTRQSIAVSALALANQSQQSVLQLLR
jgi:flagellin